jgi:hypothetical protein
MSTMSQDDVDTPTTPAGVDYGKLLIGLAAVVFIVTIAAVVFLQSIGKPTDTVEAIAGPVVAALFLGGFMQALTSGQNRTLHTIQRQTNGVLDARIRVQSKAAVLDALAEVGVASGVVVEPATPGDPRPQDAALDDSEAAGRSTLPPGFVDAALIRREDPHQSQPV